MGKVLTIEGDEAVALASELASLTGSNVEAAVTRAPRDTLSRERAAKVCFDEIMAIAAEVRPHLGEPPPTSDHSWLYGDDGLPA